MKMINDEFLPDEKALFTSGMDQIARVAKRVVVAALALSWYDMLNIASGISSVSA
jgi:hypothetical protein